MERKVFKAMSGAKDIIRLDLYYMSDAAEELERAGVDYDPHNPDHLSPRTGIFRKDQIQGVVSYYTIKGRSIVHFINGETFIARGTPEQLSELIFGTKS